MWCVYVEVGGEIVTSLGFVGGDPMAVYKMGHKRSVQASVSFRFRQITLQKNCDSIIMLSPITLFYNTVVML